LQTALEKVKANADLVNAAKMRAENIQKLVELQEIITDNVVRSRASVCPSAVDTFAAVI
jgi:hypothetical protein